MEEEEQPQISVHALSGCQSFQTMRMTGLYGKTPLHILIGKGSTHNFLDITVARKWGCRMEEIPAQAITVADGNKLQCLHVCKGFKWKIHNAIFETDMMLIPLGSCDVVLGIQWLSQLGTVRWNLNKLRSPGILFSCPPSIYSLSYSARQGELASMGIELVLETLRTSSIERSPLA